MEMGERSFEEIGKKQDNAEPENKKGNFKREAVNIRVICGRSLKKQEISRKTSISALLTMPKPLTVENSERDGHARPPDLPLEKPICRSGSNS